MKLTALARWHSVFVKNWTKKWLVLSRDRLIAIVARRETKGNENTNNGGHLLVGEVLQSSPQQIEHCLAVIASKQESG